VHVRRTAPPPAPAPLPAPDGEAEVVYTPMAWGLLGDQLALYRVVTSQGASSVQGLLVDRDALLRTWLPELAERQAGAIARVRVVGRAEEMERAQGGGRCAVRRTLPAPLETTAICLEPLATTRSTSNALILQVATLIGLVALLGAGSVTLIVGERRAARLAAMQREFVANVSHELRTPLTTLRMHAELLREGWVDEASRARFYDDLVVESTRLGQLVENVLTLSRLERGKGPKPEPGDLGASVREAVEKRRRFLELRGFAVTVEAEAAHARFDRESVDAIVANLLDNAVKYGGGSEHSIRVAVRTRPDRVLLTVADQGSGIAAAERERVFEPFYRAQGSRKGTAGTGLGLALVRRLARDQGGDAEVVPTERGCTIQVQLPTPPREAT
jgi:signal transduction histidine kinase